MASRWIECDDTKLTTHAWDPKRPTPASSWDRARTKAGRSRHEPSSRPPAVGWRVAGGGHGSNTAPRSPRAAPATPPSPLHPDTTDTRRNPPTGSRRPGPDRNPPVEPGAGQTVSRGVPPTTRWTPGPLTRHEGRDHTQDPDEYPHQDAADTRRSRPCPQLADQLGRMSGRQARAEQPPHRRPPNGGSSSSRPKRTPNPPSSRPPPPKSPSPTGSWQTGRSKASSAQSRPRQLP